MGVLVAGMTAEHVLERLTDGVAVITPGRPFRRRAGLVQRPCGRRLSVAGLVILNGGLPLHPAIAALVDGPEAAAADHHHDARYLRHRARGRATRGRVTATSQRKIDTALALMDTLRRRRGSA